MPAYTERKITELEYGGVHEGDVNSEGKFEGFGITQLEDGSIYAGEWSNS